jgi:hypothetical protein
MKLVQTPPATALAVRSAEADAPDQIVGWGMPFGGPINGRDLYGTHFSLKTNFCFDWFPTEHPLLYQHGLDPKTDVAVVGRVKAWETKSDGVWVQAQLDASSAYHEDIAGLISAGKLYFSSGAMGHLVQEDHKTGEIKRWPWVEMSLTPTPANIYAELEYARVAPHLRSIGIDADAVLATLAAKAEELDGAGADDATRSAPLRSADKIDGSYEDLMGDLREKLNAKGPFAGDSYSSIVATFADHVLVCRYDYDCDDGDDMETFWEVQYTLDEQGEPVLGDARQMEQTYQPVAARKSAAGPLILDAQRLALHAKALSQRTEDLATRRMAEARSISGGNRKALDLAIESADVALGTLRNALSGADRVRDEAVKAAALRSPAAMQQQVALLGWFLDTLPAASE